MVLTLVGHRVGGDVVHARKGAWCTRRQSNVTAERDSRRESYALLGEVGRYRIPQSAGAQQGQLAPAPTTAVGLAYQ